MPASAAVTTTSPYPPASALVKDVSGLVSPPDVCARLLALMRSSDATSIDFGDVIGRDPNLTLRLLRVANSAHYGLGTRVATVSRAVTVIGIQDLYSLVVAVGAVNSFKQIDSDLVNMHSFWRHSVLCALISRNIAKRCGVLHPERLFVAGLLHDVGSLVLFHQLPELTSELVSHAAGDEERLYRFEREALGYSHADVGGLLLTLWSLPASLHGAVRGHHEPRHAIGARVEATIVRIADRMAGHLGESLLQQGAAQNELPSAEDWAAIGLGADPFTADSLIEEIEPQFNDTVEMLVSNR